MSGISDYSTMRVRGTVGKRTLFILLDSGSSHNFMDPQVAEKLGCHITTSSLSRVTVADGRKLGVQGEIEGVEWKFQRTIFQTEVMLIPLQGCDVVLGVQWLATLGPITWEFKKLEMGFMWKNQKVWLQGIRKGSVRDVKAQKLNKLQDDQVQLAMISVKEVLNEDKTEEERLASVKARGEINPVMNKMTVKFSDEFMELKGLPLFRKNHDHKIQLVEGAKPVNQRTYSSSPYAPPIVLTQKRMALGDNVWTTRSQLE